MRTAHFSTRITDEVTEQGVAVIPEIFTAKELIVALAEFNARVQSRSRAGVRHVLKYPEMASLAHDQRMIRLASAILGQLAFPYRATVFDKSQKTNWLVSWHQDIALPLCQRRESPNWGPWSIKQGIIYAHAPATALSRIVALRIHFDDSDEENGPLRVLPRTHNLGILSSTDIENLVCSHGQFSCTIEAGGVVAMRPLIVHSSPKSVGSAPRRVLHLEYATDRKVGPGLELQFA